MENHDTRRVWIGCLASYNAGALRGQWYDLDDFTDCDGFAQAVRAMLAPNGEEWHVCDSEGWYDLEIDRYEPLESIWAKHEAFEANDHVPGAVVAHMLSEHPGCPTDAIGDCYRGTWESTQEYAQEYADDLGLLGSVPALLEHHIDWEGVARDLCMDLTEIPDGGKVHLVDPNAY